MELIHLKMVFAFTVVHLILIMCQNIRGDIHFHSMLMRKLHAFFHIL